jgi:hypothetical protein
MGARSSEFMANGPDLRTRRGCRGREPRNLIGFSMAERPRKPFEGSRHRYDDFETAPRPKKTPPDDDMILVAIPRSDAERPARSEQNTSHLFSSALMSHNGFRRCKKIYVVGKRLVVRLIGIAVTRYWHHSPPSSEATSTSQVHFSEVNKLVSSPVKHGRHHEQTKIIGFSNRCLGRHDKFLSGADHIHEGRAVVSQGLPQ